MHTQNTNTRSHTKRKQTILLHTQIHLHKEITHTKRNQIQYT